MGLRDIGATLPPGFRFYPSDEELVCHYLYKKVANGEVSKDTSLVEIDLHTCEPWQLPDVAKLNATEWYFFSFRDRKYATGYRTNRATTTGYWKATGKDRTVIDPKTRSMVGMRKTLVFYKNRAPNGIKTGWIMHEFRLENPNIPPKEDWVLCRVFHKSKTENGDDQNDVCENMMNNNIRGGAATSPTVGGSAPIDDRHALIMSRGYNSQISCYTPAAVHHQSHPYSTMLAQLDRNYLQLPHDIIHGGGADSRILHYKSEAEEDECGGSFFFDGINAGAGAPISNTLEEMQFDDDSSLVFI